MFTGIVEEMGTVENIKRGAHSCTIGIKAQTVLEDAHIGDSIAVNGICLTVTAIKGDCFTADVMHETLQRSSLGTLRGGSSVNLERAMSVNGRFGGHIVSGHIDGTGIITGIEKDDNAVWYTVKTEHSIMKYIIEKGSVAIDGISLTVAKTMESAFQVSIIPHTIQETILSLKKTGDIVNLENDIIGKYVERLLNDTKQEAKGERITKDFLLQNGF